MAHWWQDPAVRGHMVEALVHLNRAADSDALVPATQVCEVYFYALNRMWNALAQSAGHSTRADAPSFIELLESLTEGSQSTLLASPVLGDLIDLTPEVMDHHTLRSHGYRPGQKISSSLRRDVTERHRKLRNARGAFRQGGSDAASNRMLKRLAEFLYVIRSNIAHGEKTPYGPDLEKSKRDEQVSGLTIPVQKLVVNLLLDRPDWKLVAYSTLAPGGANEHVLAEVGGQWTPCIIHGEVRQENGLKLFRWTPWGVAIEASLLSSPALQDFWQRLDRFEGMRYGRHLVTIEVNGIWGVATIYEARD